MPDKLCEDYFDVRSRLLNAMGKFKESCERSGRNFKVEIDEAFQEIDED